MNYWKQMTNTKADLALYFNQDLITAGRLTQSEVIALFECPSYQNWKKSQENHNKGLSAVIGGINNVIKGLNMLGGVLGGRRRR
ncbi:MAG: hypothetical protein K0S85_11 [Pseudomonas orientalis]|nr:hypothetical protein [Pseudomonas orientalis]